MVPEGEESIAIEAGKHGGRRARPLERLAHIVNHRQRQGEQVGNGMWLLKPHSPPLMTFLQQGHTSPSLSKYSHQMETKYSSLRDWGQSFKPPRWWWYSVSENEQDKKSLLIILIYSHWAFVSLYECILFPDRLVVSGYLNSHFEFGSKHFYIL